MIHAVSIDDAVHSEAIIADVLSAKVIGQHVHMIGAAHLLELDSRNALGLVRICLGLHFPGNFQQLFSQLMRFSPFKAWKS